MLSSTLRLGHSVQIRALRGHKLQRSGAAAETAPVDACAAAILWPPWEPENTTTTTTEAAPLLGAFSQRAILLENEKTDVLELLTRPRRTTSRDVDEPSAVPEPPPRRRMAPSDVRDAWRGVASLDTLLALVSRGAASTIRVDAAGSRQPPRDDSRRRRRAAAAATSALNRRSAAAAASPRHL